MGLKLQASMGKCVHSKFNLTQARRLLLLSHVGSMSRSDPGSIPTCGSMLHVIASILQAAFLSLFTVLSIKAKNKEND